MPLSSRRLYSSKTFYRGGQTMELAYVRNVAPSELYEMTFVYTDSNLNLSRQFNFKRRITESVNDLSSRIKTNIDKCIANKVKRRKKEVITNDETDQSVTVYLLDDGTVVDGSKSCKDVFFSGRKSLTLSINNNHYCTLVNPPWIETLTMPQNIMSGFYTYPCKFEILFGSKSASRFVWSKSDTSGANWVDISEGPLLYVSEELIGCKLKLTSTPSDGEVNGPELSCTSNAVVKEGPKGMPFLLRHRYTEKPLPRGSFRVVSYNILADVYAETEAAKTELFPYCPPYARNIDYRKQLLIREILGYNADILCLQECDVRVFKHDLTNALEDYDGEQTTKRGTVCEGIATFYAKRKFRLLEKKEVDFGEEIDKNPLFSDIWQKIEKNETVRNNIKERSTVFHALVLESVETDDVVVVGNTHLYFHPKADHIRLIQGGMAVLYLTHIVNNLRDSGKKTTLIFCGDMNSTPDCGLYKLMTTKVSVSNLPDWYSDPKEVVRGGIELRQPFEMQSAYGAPPFTNYTTGFAGCLDYIYYQSDVLHLDQVVPLPDEEVLKEHVALPNQLFPSDHLALIADFTWR